MVPSTNNRTPDPQPTGDLEHLFRQKLGEAAVPPRPHIWDQLDHELLLRQNEGYRRRLVLYRWVAAACAVLVLSCGTWLLLRGTPHLPPSAQLATTSTHPEVPDNKLNNQFDSAAAPAEAAAARRAIASESAVNIVADNLLRAAKSAVGITQSNDRSLATISARPGRAADNSLAATGNRAETGVEAGSFSPATAVDLPRAPAASGLTVRPIRPLAARPAAAFRRPETLQIAARPALAELLAQAAINAPQPQTAEEETSPARPRGKWRLSGAYAATAYNPNVDFSSAGGLTPTSISLSPTAGVDNNGSSSADSYRTAYQSSASEYRDNLQAGPAQRIVVAAAYAVNKHWTLLTGLEMAQQRASSKTSYAFNDNTSAFAARPADNSSSVALSYLGQRKTMFTYRTVGVPVAVRYGSAKTGWSLYAKVGAAVNVLLKSRTEVEGSGGAARDYTLSSSDSPYRKVLTSVRGGGGIRYQPRDAAWSLALGPVAEAGLNTLNQDPGGAFFRRSRPHAVGLEASVEFGGQKTAIAR